MLGVGAIINKFGDISIKKKLILFVLIMLLYPISIIVFFGLYNNEKIIKDRFESYVENNMNNMKEKITNDLQNMEDFFLNVLYNIDLYELFESKPVGTQYNDKFQKYKFNRDMEKHLNSIIFSKQEFDLVGMKFVNDATIYYTSKERGIVDIKDIPIKKLIKKTNEKNEVVYCFNEEGENLYIYLVRAIYDLEKFDKVGIMFFRISTDYLYENIKNTYEESAESVYLYTPTGERIIYAGENQNNQVIDRNKIYLKENGSYSYDIDGYEYYVVVKTIKNADLKIISIISTDVLTADSRKVFNLIIILCLVSIPFYMFIANRIYHDLISPFTILISKMKKVEKGELDISIDINSKNEIGYLYNSFNSMTKRLKYLVEHVYEEEIARKNAELEALQAQINPHFLYNTLETINWKAQLAGEKDIAEMIQALSKLMDANINRNVEKYITVKREIEYIDNYLFLIQKRFRNKIEYEKIIGEGVLEQKLPKLIIQPIIENAVKYGVEPVGKGKIKLRIYKKNEFLMIEIEDNGEGIQKSKLEKINNELSEWKYIEEEKVKSKSIGLENVNRRLKLLYGEKSGILIKSDYMEKTTVILTIQKKEQFLQV